MITVAILINGKPIMARSAVNKGQQCGHECRYAVDDGSVILHDPSHGAVPLAIALLQTIKEQTADYETPKPKGNKCKRNKRNQ